MAWVLTDDGNYKAIAGAVRDGVASIAEFVGQEVTEEKINSLTLLPSEMPQYVTDLCETALNLAGEKRYSDGYNDGHSVGYTEGYDNGHMKGVQDEHDRFWDEFQQSGNRRNYPYAFGGSCWNNDTFNPKYAIIVNNLCTNMFAYSSQITSTKVPIIIDSSGYSTGVFLGCTRLKTIPSLKVCETNQTFSMWFQDCTALENITFTEDSVIAASISFQWSTKLTKASIESIFSALSGTASGKSLSMSKTAVNNAFTDAEWATLANTKSNWTINLV